MTPVQNPPSTHEIEDKTGGFVKPRTAPLARLGGVAIRGQGDRPPGPTAAPPRATGVLRDGKRTRVMEEETVTARVYRRLKAQVTGGAFRPGERLDPGRLAKEMEASETTLYNVLRRLAGERLIDASPQEGFHVLGVTEAQIRGLHRWICLLGSGSVEHAAPILGSAPDLVGLDPPDAALDLTTRTEALFMALAALPEIDEFCIAMAQANERVRAVRRLEAHVFADLEAELAALIAAEGDPDQLVGLLAAYRDRRLAATSDLMRLRLRGGAGLVTSG